MDVHVTNCMSLFQCAHKPLRMILANGNEVHNGGRKENEDIMEMCN